MSWITQSYWNLAIKLCVVGFTVSCSSFRDLQTAARKALNSVQNAGSASNQCWKNVQNVLYWTWLSPQNCKHCFNITQNQQFAHCVFIKMLVLDPHRYWPALQSRAPATDIYIYVYIYIYICVCVSMTQHYWLKLSSLGKLLVISDSPITHFNAMFSF